MKAPEFHVGLVQATGPSGGGVYHYTLGMINALNAAEPPVRPTLLRWQRMAPIPRDRFQSKWGFIDLPETVRTKPSEIKPFLRQPGFMLDHAGVNRLAHDFLNAHQFDLLIHPVPHPFAFECGQPFLMAIHDLQHRLQPEFPEVSAGGQWDYREYLYGNAARFAAGILVDSAVGKEDVLQCYPNFIEPEKIHILPYAAPIRRSAPLAVDNQLQSIRTKYGLPDRYLFYPAQFWLHKNHARIVQALQGIRTEHGVHVPLVLVGSRKGLPYEQREKVFNHVMGLAAQLGVQDLIHYLGYVPDEDMPALYTLARALVMPTFFGPTNIPVYEAWEYGCAVITSDIRGIREQVADAALLVDPREPRSIAGAIRTVWTNDARRIDLVEKGKLRLRGFSSDAFRARVLEIVRHLQAAAQPSSGAHIVSGGPICTTVQHSPVGISGEPDIPPAGMKPALKRSDGSGKPAAAGIISGGQPGPDLSAKALQLREQMARWYLSCNNDELHRIYAGQAGDIFRRIITERAYETSTPAEHSATVRGLMRGLRDAQNPEERLKHVMGLMLFQPAHELTEFVDIAALPEWCHEDFILLLLKPPGSFRDRREQEASDRHLRRQLEAMRQSILQKPQDRHTHQLAMTFAETASFLTCYFSAQPLKPLLVQRAEILDYALRHRGCKLNHVFQPQRAASCKIRLGVYSRSIFPCSESFATLPVFRRLDRAQFEVCLYVHHSDSNPVEELARRHVDQFTVLPESINQSAARIRSHDLDILFFGNNLTASYGPGVVMASHRLARIQMIHFCNPVTTGMRYMDRFLVGSLIAGESGPESEFAEKTLIIEGSGICFDMDPSPLTSPSRISRHDLGVSPQETVFISGANLFKIIPGLRLTWARILQEIPNSALVLYPFGPAWAADYPKKTFVAEFTRTLAEYGVNANRLVVVDTLKERAQVGALNRIADVYLDAIPYSGATSLLDPLEVGLPPVVTEGKELRFTQAAAMLKELGVPELVTRNEDEYIRLAVRIGTDKCMREDLSRRIIERMNAGPDFLNPDLYGRRVSRALLSLFPDFRHRAASESGTPAERQICRSSAAL